MPFDAAIKATTTHQEDFILPYVKDLRNVIDMEAIRAPISGLEWTRSAGPPSSIGSRSMSLWTEYHGREPEGRSDFFVHDGRSRRQNPHGLLESLRNGRTGRLQG